MERPYDSGEDALERILHRKQKSWVMFTILAVNIAVFLYAEASGGSTDLQNMLRLGAAYTPLIRKGQYYRLFTSMFLHFGPGHLFSNMLALFFLGDFMERYLGKTGFLIVYLGGGLCGNLFSMAMELRSGDYSVSAGASGAVFALMGGMLVALLMHHGKLEDLTLRRLIIYIALSLWAGFQTAGIDVNAHLGGLTGGALLSVIPLLVRNSAHLRRNTVDSRRDGQL